MPYGLHEIRVKENAASHQVNDIPLILSYNTLTHIRACTCALTEPSKVQQITHINAHKCRFVFPEEKNRIIDSILNQKIQTISFAVGEENI